MSEYQYLGFRAIDAPVSDKNLEYMERQSTRAEITPWTFDNEYHFGDFSGNAMEMLRRGYDVHFHYANYGIRSLFIRLPSGFSCDSSVASYIDEEGLSVIKDKRGPGVIFAIEPFYEPGDLEELWDDGGLYDRLCGVRAELLSGDLRPLYLASLSVRLDCEHDPDETLEAPAPAGLDQLTSAQSALAEYLGLDKFVVEAAAMNSDPLPQRSDRKRQYAQWLESQPEKTKNKWLLELLAEERSTVRAKILTAFHEGSDTLLWPTTPGERTMRQLIDAAEALSRGDKARVTRENADRLAELHQNMSKDPKPFLKKVDQLIKQQTMAAYGQAAKLLADLRDVLADGTQSTLADDKAQKLREKYPTRRHMISVLKKQGFLNK
jgi:hypothetical protein